jgi:endonuclease-8
MPEGPEIHGQARRLRAFLEGHRPAMECFYAPLQQSFEPLQGQKLDHLEARGKAFLFHFEAGQTFYAHMQLYGRWMFVQPGVAPKTNRLLRLRMATPRQEGLLFSATDLAVLTPEGLRAHPYLSKLGPDLLDPRVTTGQLIGTLQEPRFQRRQLASLLLDQSFWAGSGNYIRSEILFCAGLSPETKPSDLDGRQRHRTAGAARGLALRSLETKGLTNHPELVKRARLKGAKRATYRHWVFGREGLPCWICQTPIVKEEWGGRRLYRCLGCKGGGPQELDFPEIR